MFRLYDTRTRRVEAIAPAGRGVLRMYSCGPAVHRRQHLGDLRGYLVADLIRRNAEVRHHLTALTCQDISDVAHLADGGTAPELARRHEDAFRADCSALNLRPAENSPRASEWTGAVIDMIARLIEAGHAYPAPDGSVYFDARSVPAGGELSGHSLAEQRPDHRPGDGKRSGADWALWTGAAGRELAWPAPWGTGFPGRAAACSALSLHYLGEVIDIQVGGAGLRFPHHEDERAQSDSVTGHEVVRHWVHAEHLRFGGREMTESAGNVVLLDGLADRGLDPLALRLAFLSRHYRQPLNLSWDALGAADGTLRRWRELVAEWACSPSKPMHGETTAQIAAAFDDDLDTPAALRALRLLEEEPQIPPGSKFESFAHADQLIGLDLARDIGRAPVSPPLSAPKRNESPA